MLNMTRKEAEKFGRAQRQQLGRSALADFHPEARTFDPIKVIQESCRNRIPELLPIKFKLMADSVFSFFRGTVEIMAADLAAGGNTGIRVQLCGDAHVRNFGFFATPDAQVICDVNDFDETYPGPWEWDVKRVITSIVLAAREAGVNNAGAKLATQTFLSEYCRWIQRFAAMPTIEVFRHRVKRNLRQPAMHRALLKAQRSTPLESLKKLARRVGGQWKFRSIPSQLWQIKGAERKAVLDALPKYRATLSPDHQFIFDQFQPVDVAFKVVGTGSVGTRDYIVLMLGHDQNDPLFLQIKEEPASIYASYLQFPAPNHEGRRVAQGQRLLQVQSDLLLGWCSINGRDYLVRQMNDHKSSLDIAELRGRKLLEYSRLCAELLAKGHARSGDPMAIAAYLGSGQKAATALLRFAFRYADQVKADYLVFCKAFRGGKLIPPKSKVKTAQSGLS